MKVKQGFTLIELLVVISIIAVLSVMGMVLFTNVQRNGRNTKRIADMKAIALALEQFHNDPANNFQYPNPGGGWRGECAGFGGFAANDVIPGLVPGYMAAFPSDPAMDRAANTSCYIYLSNGNDYALLDIGIAEFATDRNQYFNYRSFVDPARDNGSDVCQLDGVTPSAWKISSEGGRCW